MAKKKILATSWHTGGANAISPVIKLILEGGLVEVVVIGHGFSERVFRAANINYRALDSWGLRDVSVRSMGQLLEKEKPDLVLIGTSVQDSENKEVIDQTITLAAREMGILVLAVLDFWAAYSQRFSDVFTGENLVFLPDKIAVMDSLAKEAMIAEGFPKDILVITGNPYFDSLADLRQGFGESGKQRIRGELDLGQDAYVILFASQPIEFHYGGQLGFTEKTALRELLEAIATLQERQSVCLLVKVHPAETKSELEEIVAGCGFPVVVDQDCDIRLAVMASDVVVSPFSTVLVEAVHLGKPAVSLQPGLKGDDLLITNELGVTLPIYRAGEMRAVLEKLLSDKSFSEGLVQRGQGFSTDGRAGQRVADLVYEMLGIDTGVSA